MRKCDNERDPYSDQTFCRSCLQVRGRLGAKAQELSRRDEVNQGASYDWRFTANLQRLRTGIHFHGRRSGIFPRPRLFSAQAVQTMPSGKEERTTGWWVRWRLRRRWRLSQRWRISGNRGHLRRMRTADDCSLRTSRRSSGFLPKLLSVAVWISRFKKTAQQWRRQRSILKNMFRDGPLSRPILD